ncbi:hypothetical protein [Listeria seeligeri]|uniref:hypothetical protein n=1 Tax=Listeria seeligeri TaxID=1640 RepID=UPI0030CBEEE1
MKKSKQWLKVFLIIFGAIVIVFAGLTILNKTFHTSYKNMDKTDQAFFKQLNTLYSKTKNEPLWQGDDLAKNPVVFVRKGDHLNFSDNTVNLIRGNVYAVGVKGLRTSGMLKKLTYLILMTCRMFIAWQLRHRVSGQRGVHWAIFLASIRMRRLGRWNKQICKLVIVHTFIILNMEKVTLKIQQKRPKQRCRSLRMNHSIILDRKIGAALMEILMWNQKTQNGTAC